MFVYDLVLKPWILKICKQLNCKFAFLFLHLCTQIPQVSCFNVNHVFQVETCKMILDSIRFVPLLLFLQSSSLNDWKVEWSFMLIVQYGFRYNKPVWVQLYRKYNSERSRQSSFQCVVRNYSVKWSFFRTWSFDEIQMKYLPFKVFDMKHEWHIQC